MDANDLPLTLAALVTEARSRLHEPREANLLIGHALGLAAVVLYAHPEREVNAAEATRALELVTRRARGEPIAYLLGEREFHGIALKITPQVLIPRPETELLVDLALERLPRGAPARVLDLGTGSGAIAIAIALARPEVRMIAVDRSPGALAIARENLRRHHLGNVALVQGEWLSPFATTRFDIIISNPPYVAAGDPHLEQGDVRHEPRGALTAGAEGLDDLRSIIAAAPQHLNPGGALLLEHGAEQQPAVLEMLAENGLSEWCGHHDLAGLPRAVSARRR